MHMVGCGRRRVGCGSVLRRLSGNRRNLGITLSYERDQPGAQSITLSFTVRSDFDVSPKPVVIPVTAEDPGPTIALTVRNTKGVPFTINAVRTERCEIRNPDLPQAPSA